MSINFLGAGLSGLNTAQTALATVGHNVANAGVEGFHRQRVLTQANQPQFLGGGFVGKGVEVIGIERVYDNFLDRQWREASALAGHLASLATKTAQVDGMLADGDASLLTAMQAHFAAWSAVSDSPTSAAQRQLLLSTGSTLAGRFASLDSQLDGMRRNIEESIDTTVGQINALAERIATLNGQIVTFPQSGRAIQPNDLLDARDAAVFDLAKLIDVQVTRQQDGSLTVSAGNGQALVIANQTLKLATRPDPLDPGRRQVVFSPGGALVELPESFLQSGELGALLRFRGSTLDPVQRELGRLAVVLSDQINRAHRQGFDADGQAGGDFFADLAGSRPALAAIGNPSATVVSFAIADSSQIAAQDYRMEFLGGQWRVRSSAGELISPSGSGSAVDPFRFGGLTVVVAGSPAEGDRFLVQALRAAASSLDVLLQDTGKVAAAASPGAAGDGRNALAIADLQRSKLVGGRASLAEGYGQMVGTVGVQTASAQARSDAQMILAGRLREAQQRYSGVNLDEEAANLLRFQQAYQASAKLIEVANRLFGNLLEI